MRKIALLICLLPLTLWAQDQTHTVSGRVTLKARSGDVYVMLSNREQFKNLFSGIDTLVIKTNYDRTSVDFEFPNLPAGEYAITCFQDVNRNGRVDKWPWGPREPWGFSWNSEMKFPPTFDQVSFYLVDDLRINIILGK
jgi:uncharacterized protein (DUF2141 family)